MVKKYSWLSVIVVLVILGFFLISCNRTSESNNSSTIADSNTSSVITEANFVGIWDLEDEDSSLEFFNDGTGIIDGRSSFTWVLRDGNRLQLVLGGRTDLVNFELTENNRLLKFIQSNGWESYYRKR